MATYHCSVKVVSRSTGRSAVGAAAYRAGEKIINERDGITHDYTRKGGCEYSEIVLPENAPERLYNRSELWNEVERSEKRKDAQTAREIEVALPVELSLEEQAEMVREYAKSNFVEKGMCVDFAIHDKGDGNPHAHIMLTTREVSPDGFGKKEREWNDRQNVEQWRENWADTYNHEMEKKSLPDRVDHRSLAAQGIERAPQIHLGAAHKMEQRGVDTDRGSLNREVMKDNMEYQKGLDELQQEFEALREQAAADRLAEETQQTDKQHQQEQKQAEEEKEQAEKRRQQEEKENREQFHAAQERDRPEVGQAVPEQERGQRFDEEETRSWQRGDGLQREDTNAAQYEALAGEPQPEPADRAGQRDPSAPPQQTEPTTQQIADRLNEINRQNQQLAIEARQLQEQLRQQQTENRQLDGARENAQQDRQRVENFDRQLEELKQQRGQLGIFAGKEKREIDSQIEKLQESREQAAQSFAQHREEYQQLKAQAEKRPEQPDHRQRLDEIREQQTQLKEQFQEINQQANMRPDSKEIRALYEAGRKEQEQAERPQSMQDRMAAYKAQADLQNQQRQAERSQREQSQEMER